MAERIEAARSRFPTADLRVGSAHELPYPHASFDLVCQMTLFSSVVDPGLRAAIAVEMLRVVRPGGLIVWYDAHRAASSSDFAPIGRDELGRLFGGCRIDPSQRDAGVVAQRAGRDPESSGGPASRADPGALLAHGRRDPPPLRGRRPLLD
jgi:SAM-dependent methyltransferase